MWTHTYASGATSNSLAKVAPTPDGRFLHAPARKKHPNESSGQDSAPMKVESAAPNITIGSIFKEVKVKREAVDDNEPIHEEVKVKTEATDDNDSVGYLRD
jgi:hypothetical protein